MRLRSYQHNAVEGILEAFEDKASALLVLPTGTGKTIVFAHLIKRMLADHPGKRVMVMAHREELIYQAAEKIEAVTGEKPDIEMAGQWAAEVSLHKRARVVVASKDTLRTKKRMHRFDPDDFCLLITDEAHHATAKTYRKVYDYFHRNPNLKHLGVTATPDRTDEAALGQVFAVCAFDYGINDAVDDGWLVPIHQTSVTVGSLDISGVRTTAGDLNGKDLAEVLEQEENIHQIVSPTVEITADRKTLIFAHSLKQAEQICDVLNRHKPNSARWCSGETPKDTRRFVLQDFASGRIQYLVNMALWTEGFDAPDVQCIVMARPTKSRSLFSQMVGRGTRPLPGIVDDLIGDDRALFDDPAVSSSAERREAIAASAKPFCEVIDFVGNCGKHKLVSVADILGGNYSDEVVERAKAKLQQGMSTDVAEALQEAEEQLKLVKRLEREQLMKVKARAEYTTRTVDPFDILDIEPVRERAYDKGQLATDKQVKAIKNFTGGRVDASEFTKRKATQLIGKLIKRREDGQCTFKQAQLLAKYGYDTNTTMQEASQIIDGIKADGWRMPPPQVNEPVTAEEFAGF